jgi:hypothetical protein
LVIPDRFHSLPDSEDDYIPDESEVVTVKELISQSEQDIQHFEKEIRVAKALLTRLRRGRTLLRQRIDRHRAFIAPIRKIPCELLLVIFNDLFQAEDHDDEEPDEGFRRVNDGLTTLHLSHVCRKWRSITFAKPSFWARIDFQPFPDLAGKSVTSLIGLYLKRSQDEPLTIAIPHSADFTNPGLLSLSRHSERWRRVDYEPDNYKQNLLTWIIQRSMPRLESSASIL